MELAYVSAEKFSEVQNSDKSFAEKIEIWSRFCRINILYMIQSAGSGHIGSSFSALEIYLTLLSTQIDTARFKNFSVHADVILNSKGHDVPAYYAALIGLGFLDPDWLHRFRQRNGLPGHPDVATPYIGSNTGSLGMGISKAKGILAAKQRLKHDGRVYVILGDGELQEGQVWESIYSIPPELCDRMILIVDQNHFQTAKSISADFHKKFESFGCEVQSVQGHSISELKQAFLNAQKASGKPQVILANTIKGKGVSFLEGSVNDSHYLFHAGALSPEDYVRAVEELARGFEKFELLKFSTPRPRMGLKLQPTELKDKYTQLISQYGQQYSGLVCLEADLLADTGLSLFAERWSDRLIECGIAEMDMVSMAGAASRQGLKPVCHSFAAFLSSRAHEQIFNNCTENNWVLYSAFLAGVLPAAPGVSHQAVNDVAALKSFPNMTVFSPSHPRELELGLNLIMAASQGGFYLRIESGEMFSSFSYPELNELKVGQGVILQQGPTEAILASGPLMVSLALEVAKEMRRNLNRDIKVVSVPWLNKVDLPWAKNCFKDLKKIYILENHAQTGGYGEFFISQCFDFLSKTKIKIQALKNGPQSGQNDEVLSALGFTPEQTYQSVTEFFEHDLA